MLLRLCLHSSRSRLGMLCCCLKFGNLFRLCIRSWQQERLFVPELLQPCLERSLERSFLNCMVVVQLMVVLDWRATMLLICGLSTVALLGVKFFVSDGPAAGTGRVRLSDGEAALFRAEGMLYEQSSGATKEAATGVGRLAATSLGWALIAVEMSVAWR